jgi:hypothetical protein
MSRGDPSTDQGRARLGIEIVHAGSGVKRKSRKGTLKPRLFAVPLLEVQAGAIGQGGSQFTDFASATVEEMIAVSAMWCPNPPGQIVCA